jgi:predicted amidohydrolase
MALVAAAIQMTSGIESAPNIDAVERLVALAVDKGARYVLTPEVTLNYAPDLETLRRVATEESIRGGLAVFAALAQRYEIFLHLGSMATPLLSGRFANRSVLIGPDGEATAQYDKIHLFDADIGGEKAYRESHSYEPGEEAVLTRLPEFALGMTVCYDVRFPSLYTRLAAAGATLFAVPAAFTVPTGEAHWATLIRARAIETGAFVVAAAQAGVHQNGRRTWGHSMIVDPWGRVLAESGAEGEDVIVATLDPDLVTKARHDVPNLANMRGFSVSVNQDLS